MSNPLTPTQKKTYDYLVEYIQENGYAPSLKKIADHFGRTVPTISQHVKMLAKKGYLELQKGTDRGIVPVLKDPFSAAVDTPKRTFAIGIIGHGIVGQAVAYGFSNHQLSIYDKYKHSETLEEVIERSDYIFICLPTPIKNDESGIDLSIIDENIEQIAPKTAGTDKIIIIKSTVVPGTTKDYSEKYPQSLFAFNPEFLTERSFLQDFINSDRTVIGAENDLVARRVSALYQTIMPNTPIFLTDPTTAEMTKYMANCFLATKVIFANEMYDICEKLDISYEEAKSMMVADSRINDTHLDVTTLRGFGGKCFPKDLLALRALAKSMKVDTTILDCVWRKNLSLRNIHDWEEIPFAVSDESFGHKG